MWEIIRFLSSQVDRLAEKFERCEFDWRRSKAGQLCWNGAGAAPWSETIYAWNKTEESGVEIP